MVDLQSVLEAGRLLAAATLKGSALIVVVAMIQWIGREKIPAGWRYAMWLLVIVRLLLPAAPPSQFSMFNLMTAGVSPLTFAFEEAPSALSGVQARAEESGSGPVSSSHPLPVALMVIWAAGALALALRAIAGSARLALRLRKDGREELSDPRLEATVALCARELGIRRKVGVIETSAVGSPALHGIFFPRLLVPGQVMAQFTDEELRYIVLHEMAHLRRADVLVNVIAAAVECLHWFNPLVWIALARMREERELACDRAALARIPAEARAEYGRTVLKLLDCFRSTTFAPALVGMASRHDEMKRRIHMIAAFRKSTRASLAFAGVIALLGFASLTDAQTVKHAIFHSEMTPEAKAAFDRLNEPIKVEFKETSVFDIAQSITGKAGVALTIAPEAAASIAAAPKISLTAENLPGAVALMEALTAVDLSMKFTAAGVEITRQAEGAQRIRVIHTNGTDYEVEEDRMVLLDGAAGQWEEKIDDESVITTTEDGKKVERIFVRKIGDGEVQADGKEIRKKVMVIKTPHGEESGEVNFQHLGDAKLEIKVHKEQ